LLIIRARLRSSCKERFEKNKNKLFTFLKYDGIPWNNDNAEHAIKAFAMLRNVMRGTSTAKVSRIIFLFLLFSETCTCQGLDFLDSLRSREENIHEFAENRQRGARKVSARLVGAKELPQLVRLIPCVEGDLAGHRAHTTGYPGDGSEAVSLLCCESLACRERSTAVLHPIMGARPDIHRAFPPNASSASPTKSFAQAIRASNAHPKRAAGQPIRGSKRTTQPDK